MSQPNDPSASPSPSGLPAALGAYIIWGFLPLYLLLVTAVPPFEFVGWRIIWTLPLCLLIVAFRSQFAELRRALSNKRTMLALFASAILIAINWFVYIWAIMQNQVYAASLGYYLNPLLNVLLGDMTLVGPRPPIPAEVAQYNLEQRGRLAVKAGLTCLWQVSGRSDLPFAEQVRLDLDYVSRRSLALDIQILLRTVPAVLLARGAY